MIPTRVVNTLNLGRAVAAKVDTGEPGWTAWLFIRGIAESARTWDAISKAWTLDRTATQPFEPPSAFVVRYTRLSDAHLALPDALDLTMRTDPPEDWIVVAPDLDAVERISSRFLDDLDTLRPPANVDYPEPPPQFARERTLDEVLGPT
jgi:hypothetical protein